MPTDTSGTPPAPGEAVRRRLRQVELTVTRRLAGLMQGDYLGLFPGPGTEAGECRLYVPGDDVRLMDWNVSARTTVAHVRDPIFDHELDVWLVADLSASQSFGTAARPKRDVVVSVAAGFGVPASRLANRVGAVVLDGNGVSHLPARPGRRHLLAVLHRMATAGTGEGGGRTDLVPALATLDRLARRRGVVVVISDFLVTPGWERLVGRLAARHDVIAAEVLDPRELELPAVGLLTLADPETGAVRVVDTASARLRERFARGAAEQRAAIGAASRRAGADHLVVRTDSDWVAEVVAFLVARRRRRRGYRAVPVGSGPR
ncbi:MAG: DUF58 domain-containing protein [Acidimicrobiales bacterium]